MNTAAIAIGKCDVQLVSQLVTDHDKEDKETVADDDDE